jgi:hypothetical protein
MAIQTINIGTVANDGSGDDLRDAFRKVNDNFNELFSRDYESTTASNRGVLGEGIFAAKVGFDLQFKKIAAGNNITLTATDNVITVNALGGLQSLVVVSDNGSTVLQDGDTLNIQGGTNITTQLNGVTNTLLINGQVSLLVDESSPALSTTLDANNNNFINVGTINGISLSSFEKLLNFDFDNISVNINNWVDYLTFSTEVDLGSISAPTDLLIDLGSI